MKLSSFISFSKLSLLHSSWLRESETFTSKVARTKTCKKTKWKITEQVVGVVVQEWFKMYIKEKAINALRIHVCHGITSYDDISCAVLLYLHIEILTKSTRKNLTTWKQEQSANIGIHINTKAFRPRTEEKPIIMKERGDQLKQKDGK